MAWIRGFRPPPHTWNSKWWSCIAACVEHEVSPPSGAPERKDREGCDSSFTFGPCGQRSSELDYVGFVDEIASRRGCGVNGGLIYCDLTYWVRDAWKRWKGMSILILISYFLFKHAGACQPGLQFAGLCVGCADQSELVLWSAFFSASCNGISRAEEDQRICSPALTIIY